MTVTTVQKTGKIDTGLSLQAGTADRALGEVMRELSQVASGGAMTGMQHIITAQFPDDAAEVEKFMAQLERLKRAAESSYSLAVGEQNARRSKT